MKGMEALAIAQIGGGWAIPGENADLAELVGLWLPCWPILLALSFFQVVG